MKAKGIPHTLIVTSIAALGLSACGPDVGNRTAGQKVGQAIDRTQSAVEKAGEKSVQAVENAADKAADAMKDAGKSVQDAAITASVKAELVKDPALSALKIEVETKEGVVTLNGVAPNETSADRAAQIAIAVSGVREVRNHVAPRRG